MERDEMPDAADPRLTFASVRRGILIVSLLLETLMPRSTRAQLPLLQNLLGNWSGAITLTQPLNHTTPGNLAQQVVVDSSPRALAPWTAVGLRWSLSDWNTHAIGDLGLRWRRRSLRMALGLSQDAVYDSLGTDYVMQSVTDVIGSLHWHAGRITVGGETGWRLAGPAQHQFWYQTDLATSFTPQLALMVGVDRRSNRGASSSMNHLTLGIQWQWRPPGRQPRTAATPRPRGTPSASPRASPIAGDRLVVHQIQDSLRLRLRLVSTPAHQVEARGDLTDWIAVPMEHRPGDVWQLTLPASPGVHRLAVRVDGGAWQPPPGVPVGTDGYGGAVGLFTVEP